MCRRHRNSDVYIIDIGVNNGEDVQSWADLFVGCANRKFLLIEPQVRYRNSIHRMIKKLGVEFVKRTTFLEVAVGNATQHNAVVNQYGDGPTATISGNGGARQRKGGRSVRLVSLNQVLPPDARVAFLKIDCEGADATILMNIENLFAAKRVDVAVFEFNRMESEFDVKVVTALSMLESHGYHLYLAGVDPENVVRRMRKVVIFMRLTVAHSQKAHSQKVSGLFQQQLSLKNLRLVIEKIRNT